MKNISAKSVYLINSVKKRQIFDPNLLPDLVRNKSGSIYDIFIVKVITI